MAAIVMTIIQLAAVFYPALPDILEWSRNEMAQGQWWRMLTGHWIHLGMTHLGLNLAGLVLLIALFDRSLPPTWYAGYLLAAPVAISFGLVWVAPGLDWYRGFSGSLHGLFALLALANMPLQPRWNLMLLTGLAVKLILEPYFPGGSAELIGAPVIYQAHWLGALTGLAAGLLLLFCNRQRLRGAQGPPSPE